MINITLSALFEIMNYFISSKLKADYNVEVNKLRINLNNR